MVVDDTANLSYKILGSVRQRGCRGGEVLTNWGDARDTLLPGMCRTEGMRAVSGGCT